MSQWTKQAPTEPGHYWFRWLAHEVSKPELFDCIRHPRSGKICVIDKGHRGKAATAYDGDWWPEPVKPPPS